VEKKPRSQATILHKIVQAKHKPFFIVKLQFVMMKLESLQ